jgi:hypothetical protein
MLQLPHVQCYCLHAQCCFCARHCRQVQRHMWHVRSAAIMQAMLPLCVGVIVAKLGVLMSLSECCMMVQTLCGILLLGGA